MTDMDKVLQALERLENGQKAMQDNVKSLQEGQQTLLKSVDQQGKAIVGLQEGQNVLELKVEAFHTEQRRAKGDIISTLHEIVEINAKETEKRIDRIEKHLNLPPMK